MSTLLFKVISFLVGLLPWAAAQRLGAVLGQIWFSVVRIRRRVVFENLARALPDRAPDHSDIARDAYRHFGVSALELMKMSRMHPEAMAQKVRLHGMAHFERAYARGRGVIVVTAHYGNFDLLACSQAARGIPIAIVSRYLHGQGVNRFWMGARRSSGLEIYPDEGRAKDLLRWLRAGRVIGLTVDQRTPASRGGVPAPFMGWRVWTTTAPAAIAMASRAAIVPVHIERRSNGYHDLLVEPEITIPMARREEAITLLTNEINQVVAGWINRRPEHWLWLHRRFKGAMGNHDLESCAPKG